MKRKNPRWNLEKEDDAAEEADKEGIRVFPRRVGVLYL
jgi:hypothetical protein